MSAPAFPARQAARLATFAPAQARMLEAAIECHLKGKHGEAAALYQRLIIVAPGDFRLNHLLGGLRLQQGRPDEALALLERARKSRPNSAPTLVCLAMALNAVGRAEEGEKALRRALDVNPRSEEAWNNLGALQLGQGRVPDALVSCGRALELKPGFAPAWTALGSALHLSGRLEEAVVAHARALELDPANPQARIGRGQALQGCHRVEEALADFETQLAARPGDLKAMSARLFLLNFRDDLSPEVLAAEHAAFGRAAEAAARVRGPDAAPERVGESGGRLRLAMVSPDLRSHSVAWFLEPLLRHLDRSQFELTLYHDHPLFDSVSERFRRLADRWRRVAGLPDEAFESLVRRDAPDILIDLAGHSGFNRVGVFARRLAPVQITYLGYPNTTGLVQMDYRFTDAVADPPGHADRLHTERLVRFSPTAWAFSPPEEALAPLAPRGAAVAGSVVFGSFNALSKLNPATLRLWREVLEAVPGSRLVLKSPSLVADHWRRKLELAGLEAARVELREATPTREGHFAAYGEIDVALDPVPYNGTTTTCDALWMGVPVVTLAGKRSMSRSAASILTSVGR
ncbi:MAG: tetratricopeptide repeat protein, partial [Opitutaceae bacterium]